MVFHLHGEALYRRVQTGALGHSPALHHAVELEPQVVVQVTGGVLLNDEGQLCLLASLPPRGSAVRVKSRFRRYSASCDSAFAADLAGVDAFFELVRLPLAVGFLGIMDFLLWALFSVLFSGMRASSTNAVAPGFPLLCSQSLVKLAERVHH